MKRIWSLFGVGLVAAGLLLATVGCDSGGGDSDSVNSVVGRWAVVNQDDGGQTWWQFNADGSFVYYNDPAFTSAHLSGTYSQDGNKVKGPFTNPGVGEGEIDCTLSADGNQLQMDFIEHWHSPFKHVPLAGTRI